MTVPVDQAPHCCLPDAAETVYHQMSGRLLDDGARLRNGPLVPLRHHLPHGSR